MSNAERERLERFNLTAAALTGLAAHPGSWGSAHEGAPVLGRRAVALADGALAALEGEVVPAPDNLELRAACSEFLDFVNDDPIPELPDTHTFFRHVRAIRNALKGATP